jgi:glycosyltransferase involved in cell wall biosynthesis
MFDLALDFANTPDSALRPRFNYTPIDDSAEPVVSIVTPCYNTGEIFLDTAKTVERQSLQQWEWLIVNDASSSPVTLRILDGLRCKDPRIQIIDLESNHGPGAARNVAIRQARAESVFFLDSDDLIEPTALEKMAWCLDVYPQFAFCKGLTMHFGAEEFIGTTGFEAGSQFLSVNPVTPRALVRRQVALSVDGFDESLRDGLEDWEFWLRCAARGFWGYSIQEFLDWYRRRIDHSDRWSDWTGRGEREMRREFRRRYPELSSGAFPTVTRGQAMPYAGVPDELPFANTLTKEQKRILLILPWMAMGGADKFNLDLMDQLAEQGYEISVATTLPDNYQWYRAFAARTPDLFILPNFLRPVDYPRFLGYLCQSRNIDVVLVSNSELGYRFLPYLRARHPDIAFVDYCHIEEEYWNNGGHPRTAVAYQEVLDLNVVSSRHLKKWMTGRGGDPARIEVCHTNVDTDLLRPDENLRAKVRKELSIPSSTPVILFAGRLCEQKQPRMFAHVMRELRTRGLQFVCLVAGDGEDREWLSSYLRRNRLRGQVRMLGAVSNERVRHLLAASDILFLPSKHEGVSLTIFEAMAMAVVPVGADVGGQRELVTPECGVLIEPGVESATVTAYASALAMLLTSPEKCQSLGQASRERVHSMFRIEQMGERMVALLASAMEQRRSQPKPAIGLQFGIEHAAQAIELQRLGQAASGLWKYQRAETATRRMMGPLLAIGARLRRLRWQLFGSTRPLQRAKDALWIQGHRLKVRLSLAEEID